MCYAQVTLDLLTRTSIRTRTPWATFGTTLLQLPLFCPLKKKRADWLHRMTFFLTSHSPTSSPLSTCENKQKRVAGFEEREPLNKIPIRSRGLLPSFLSFASRSSAPEKS